MESLSTGKPRSDRPIELKEDRRFQERWWTVERVAWVGFTLIILVALSGLTGMGGPLARGNASGEHGRLEFPLASRWQADDHLRIELDPTGSDLRTVGLSQEFTDLFQIIDMEPRPVRSIAGDKVTRYQFAVTPTEQGNVDLNVRSTHPGAVSYYVELDGQRLAANTFVWP